MGSVEQGVCCLRLCALEYVRMFEEVRERDGVEVVSLGDVDLADL